MKNIYKILFTLLLLSCLTVFCAAQASGNSNNDLGGTSTVTADAYGGETGDGVPSESLPAATDPVTTDTATDTAPAVTTDNAVTKDEPSGMSHGLRTALVVIACVAAVVVAAAAIVTIVMRRTDGK